MSPCVCTSALLAFVLAASFIVQPAATQTSETNNDALPVNYPAKILPRSDTICPSTEEQETTFAEIDQEISTLIRSTVLTTLECPGVNAQYPASSCLEIAECDPSLPSGYYEINATTFTIQVYCDMDREASCSSGTGGWTRVAYVNLTDPADQCPSQWRQTESPIPFPVRTCGRRTDDGCDSVSFNTYGIQYSNIVGRVVGYQFGSPDAFVEGTSQTIDGNYLDGVSITRGMPRNHIWSFTAENNDNYRCPCSVSTSHTAPLFVGEDYFCESGNAGSDTSNIFYPDDPLWDGQDCGSNPTCCTYNNPPWFCKQLPQATTDDIEIRICARSGLVENEDTPIELIEIYVQ